MGVPGARVRKHKVTLPQLPWGRGAGGPLRERRVVRLCSPIAPRRCLGLTPLVLREHVDIDTTAGVEYAFERRALYFSNVASGTD